MNHKIINSSKKQVIMLDKFWANSGCLGEQKWEPYDYIIRRNKGGISRYIFSVRDRNTDDLFTMLMKLV